MQSGHPDRSDGEHKICRSQLNRQAHQSHRGMIKESLSSTVCEFCSCQNRFLSTKMSFTGELRTTVDSAQASPVKPLPSQHMKAPEAHCGGYPHSLWSSRVRQSGEELKKCEMKRNLVRETERKC